jgi:hypothetical protein
MFRVRILLAAVLAASALAVLAGPASATAPAANTKFCKAVNKIGTTGSSSNPTKSQAKAALSGFKNAAKYAPRKVKSALNNISKYLGAVVNADNASDLAHIYTSGGFKHYTKSLTTYVKYYTANCLGTS